jgi:hypothetical protein
MDPSPLLFGKSLLVCRPPKAYVYSMAWQTGTSAPFYTDPNYHNKGTGIAGIAAVFAFSWAFSWSFGPGMNHFARAEWSSTDEA